MQQSAASAAPAALAAIGVRSRIGRQLLGAEGYPAFVVARVSALTSALASS
jgi:hypothetical protein